jgi:hypothetical protein
VTPIVFFFDISQLALAVFAHFSAWGWIGLLVVIFICFVLCAMYKEVNVFCTAALVVLLAYLPFGFHRFGSFLASMTTSFYTAPSSCIPGSTERMYIAPTISEGKMIFVPIDPKTNKLQNGLLVRNDTDITCQVEKKEIGKIEK